MKCYGLHMQIWCCYQFNPYFYLLSNLLTFNIWNKILCGLWWLLAATKSNQISFISFDIYKNCYRKGGGLKVINGVRLPDKSHNLWDWIWNVSIFFFFFFWLSHTRRWLFWIMTHFNRYKRRPSASHYVTW